MNFNHAATLHGWLLPAILLCAGCAGGGSAPRGEQENSTAARELIPVKLMLNWYPEAEHGGYYAALVNGYYRDAGLDVSIVPGGPNAPVVVQTARGAVEFGVTNADRIIMARAEGALIQGLMAPLQTSPRCVLVHESSGIESLAELRDVTLMMRRENAWAQFLISNLKLENVDIAPNSAGLTAFLNDKRSAKQGYVISEPFVAKQKGAAVRTLMVAELGFNPYTSVLTTGDKYASENPAVLRRMVSASIRGWKSYLNEPAQTNAHIHSLNPEMDVEILAFGVDAMKKHCLGPDETSSIGSMTLGRWSQLIQQLEQLKMLEVGQVSAGSAFTTEFFPAD
jgi:NitT/TauT family transport system substrate-binding protein